jgi:hypothetical protein
MADTETTTKPTKYRFEELDDTTVNIAVIGENGSKSFEIKLQNVTWGMMKDMTRFQDESENRMEAVFSFFDKYIDGGASAIPLKYTLSLFEGISEYMQSVTSTQKN